MSDRNDPGRLELGRLAYGLAGVWLGIIGLIARDFAAVWQPLDNIGLGFNRPITASIYAFLFLAAGIGAWFKRSASASLATLTVLHALAMLGWIPRIPLGGWIGFFEMLSLTIAGIVAYARLKPASEVAMRAITIGQIVFAFCLLAFGIGHWVANQETASMVPTWIPPNAMFWAYTTGALYVLAGIAILIRTRAVLAARLTVAMMLSFNLFVWLPMLIANPGHVTWAGNAITFAMAAGAWVIADSLTQPQTANVNAKMLADPG